MVFKSGVQSIGNFLICLDPKSCIFIFFSKNLENFCSARWGLTDSCHFTNRRIMISRRIIDLAHIVESSDTWRSYLISSSLNLRDNITCSHIEIPISSFSLRSEDYIINRQRKHRHDRNRPHPRRKSVVGVHVAANAK